MMTEPMLSWEEANQSYLVAEFARLRNLLEPGSEIHAGKCVEDGPEFPGALPAIDRLSELFGLSAFERQVVLLCAGVEMDSKLASLCGQVQGNPQRPYATFGFAMAIFAEPHWSALSPSRPLRRFRLVAVEPGHGLTSGPLRIDERILHYLAGINSLDSRLESLIDASALPLSIAAEHESTATQASRVLGPYQQNLPIVHLCGDDSDGQEDVAAVVAQNTGRQLFVVRVEDLPPVGADLDQFAVLWERETKLLSGALLIQCGSVGLNAGARHLAERLKGLVFLSSREPILLHRALLRYEVDKPQPAEQKRLWQHALEPAGATFNGTVDALSEQFRLSARTIFSTGTPIVLRADAGHPEDLWNACRSLARPKLEDLSQRIIPRAGWEDLVLPESQERILRQLAAQVRHRMQVYETWGFSDKGRRGLGVSALFTGESGTGKTLAAEVLAHDLRLDLYRIDLSAVVSKYIGETEKNLRQFFDAAEEGGVLLLFDEADALFGKRSEVKDSHDRYANIEVGYLLQRLEAYQGLAILTTNLRSSLDKSFQRRLRFTVNFPFPDAATREAIWNRAFPAATPTEGLDARKLSQLKVSGGNIRNIALNAAFLAAQAGKPVGMAHVAEAASLEAQKVERPLSGTEVRGWV
jgi:hypothetical protein